jgi:hypothetical protein
MLPMRLGRQRDCGDLLVFEHVRRSLGLGQPNVEGEATIAVADIVGTVGRQRGAPDQSVIERVMARARRRIAPTVLAQQTRGDS